MELTAGILMVGAGLGWLAWRISRDAMRHADRVAVGGAGKGESMFLPAIRWVGLMVAQLAPGWAARCRGKDEMLLVKSGRDRAFQPSDLIGLRILAMCGCAMAAAFVFSESPLLWASVGGAVGWCLPGWHLTGRRKERQWALLRDFPTALDMMMLCLEGGLDFTAGMREIVANADPGPLQEEFSQVLREVSMGRSRAEALRRFSDRVDPIEIRTVMTSLIQAIELGAGIAPTLRVQTEQMRFSRLVRAEEQAQKAPTKMVLPMMLFIMPCVFLVILAPVALSMRASLGDF
jgi:tight adherence protein C